MTRFASRLVLLPDRFLYATPASLDLPFQEVEFWSNRGVRLRGWFIPGPRRGVVVFCPGNSGNASSHLEYVRLANQGGHSVLAFDYAGFGRSEGVPDLKRIVPDVEAACQFAQFHTRQPVALFGLSLGAAAAVAAAVRGGAEVTAVIGEGIADFPSMLRGLLASGTFGPRRIRSIAGPDGVLREREAVQLSGLRLPGVLAGLVARVGATLYPFAGKSPLRLAPQLAGRPVFLIHGVEDPLLPFEAAIDLYEAVDGPRWLWLIPGVGHAQEPVMACPAEYAAKLTAFLDGAFEGSVEKPQAARILDIHAHQPVHGGVTALLGLEAPVGPAAQSRSVSVTASGGGVLRQAILRGHAEVTMEFPGPIEIMVTSPLLAADEGPMAREYTSAGYRQAFNAMSRAVNRRDFSGLAAAVDAHRSLPRAYPYDFFAALYSLRAAQVALGLVPHWRCGDSGAAVQALERFLELWCAHSRLPGPSVPESPASWAEKKLEEQRR
jgi:pimeloyl-ACP methyl ester carboxylesterase